MFQFGPLTIDSSLILVLRGLHLRWVRSLLTALGIVVGVAAMVAVNATNRSTLTSINRFFDEASGKADLVVEFAIDGESFDQGIVVAISRFPEVIAAAPGLVGITVPAEEASDWEQRYSAGGAIVPGTTFWMMGRDPVTDHQVHQYELVAGRLLRPDETSYNLLLVDEYAEEEEIELGEDFAVITPDNGMANLRVVGLIAKEGIGITNDGAIGIAPLSVVQDLFGLTGQISQVDIVVDETFAADSASLEELRQRLDRRLGTDYEVDYPASRGELVTESLGSYQQGLDFFGVVSLFVGSFLIYNAFAMTVVERTREIGMLRALGTTRGQVLSMVLAEAGLLGVIGSAIGVGAGMMLARGLVGSVSRFSGQAIEQVTATPESLLQSMVTGVVVTLAAALLPAWHASRISPLRALQVQGTVDEGRWLAVGLKFGPLTVFLSWLVFYHVPLRPEMAFSVGSNTIFVMMLGATLCIPLLAGLLERGIRPLVIHIFGNEGRLGSANVNRARGRTTLTVAALMVGISMVVGINGLTSSFEKDIQSWVNTALGGDLFVRSPVVMRLDVESRLLAMQDVAAVTRSRYLASRMYLPSGEDEYTLFVATDPETYLSVSDLRIQEGPEAVEVMRLLAQGNGVLVGADVASQFGLEVGDDITLETKRGRQSFRVIAVVIDFSGGETTTVTGSWRDLRRYFGVNDVSTFFVRLKPGASLAKITNEIENGLDLNLSVESKRQFEEKIRELSSQAFSLFDVLGLIGLVVAALGVINTMLMNVMERTRELGSLRSLGMDRRQVRRMILAEAATMGFIGAVFGVAFGAMLSDVFIVGLESIGGFVLTPSLPYVAMGYSFLIAFALAILSAWYPAVHGSQVNIIEAIKHE